MTFSKISKLLKINSKKVRKEIIQKKNKKKK